MTDDEKMPYFMQITPVNTLSQNRARIAGELFNQEESVNANPSGAMVI